MSSKKYNILFLIVFLLPLIVTEILCFEIFSLMGGATIAAGVAVYKNLGKIKDNTVCRVMECCTDPYIPANFQGLKRNLSQTLFGQHIVLNELIPALQSHYLDMNKSKKPLVMSFHGTPGTGKNFVADRVAEFLYKKGLNSKFVWRFYGRLSFPEIALVDQYSLQLGKQISLALTVCPRSLFIFDEVDKMPPGIFEFITGQLEHHQSFDGVNCREATFIFLSNTGGTEIAGKLESLMSAGQLREDTKIHDFENVIELNAYNVDGGLKKASIITRHLIDHYLPFLPLEKKHVEKCILEEFKALHKHPSEKLIQEIATNHVTYRSLFATTGCKRLSKKVGVYAYRIN